MSSLRLILLCGDPLVECVSDVFVGGAEGLPFFEGVDEAVGFGFGEGAAGGDFVAEDVAGDDESVLAVGELGLSEEGVHFAVHGGGGWWFGRVVVGWPSRRGLGQVGTRRRNGRVLVSPLRVR